MVTAHLDPHPFLSPAEVGALLNVKAETVVRWTKAGRLRCVYTASGRRLYLKADLVVLHPELMGLATTARRGEPVAGCRPGRADRALRPGRPRGRSWSPRRS